MAQYQVRPKYVSAFYFNIKNMDDALKFLSELPKEFRLKINDLYITAHCDNDEVRISTHFDHGSGPQEGYLVFFSDPQNIYEGYESYYMICTPDRFNEAYIPVQ